MCSPSSPLLLDRYELKFLVKSHLVEEISRMVENYCELDYYSQISPSKYYVINSLYCDSFNFKLLRAKIVDLGQRFNVRLRSYGQEPKPPFYLEVKNKKESFIKKTRGKVTEEGLEALRNFEIVTAAEESSQKNVDSFCVAYYTHGLEPKIFTQYERKAYLSVIDDYARVTFDRHLRYYLEDSLNLIPDENKLKNYDHEDLFFGEDGDHILELKCPTKVPIWIFDIIKKYDLSRIGFSKYGNSMFESLSLDHRYQLPRSAFLD